MEYLRDLRKYFVKIALHAKDPYFKAEQERQTQPQGLTS